MSNAKKKDNNILQLERPSISLKETISDVISQELELLEEKSKKYHAPDSIQESVKKLGEEFEIVEQEKANGVINFHIPQDKVGQKKATIVENGKESRDIPVGDLHEAIKKNKNINRVIIEEINLNDVKRTQIHFDQTRPPINKRVNTLISDNNSKVETLTFDSSAQSEVDKSPLSSSQLEEKINQDFFSASPTIDKPAHLRSYDAFHQQEADITSNSKVEKPTAAQEVFYEQNGESLAEIKEEQANHFTNKIEKNELHLAPQMVIGDDVAESYNKSKEPVHNSNFTIDDTIIKDSSVSENKSENKIDLTIKVEPETAILPATSSSDDGSYFEAHKTDFRRKKELAKKSISSLYYKTKKHNELFKLGTLYYRDLESGLKSFAYTGQDDNQKEQQKTILGLAAYFSYHMKMTSTVFTPSFENSFFKREDKVYEMEEISLDDGLSITVYSYSDLKVIEFCELEKIIEFADVTILEDTLENVIDNHELVFWDLPSTDTMEQSNELYFPITRVIDNVSLIIKPNNSKIKEVLALKEYFEKYHIQIKGMIMSSDDNESSKGE